MNYYTFDTEISKIREAEPDAHITSPDLEQRTFWLRARRALGVYATAQLCSVDEPPSDFDKADRSEFYNSQTAINVAVACNDIELASDQTSDAVARLGQGTVKWLRDAGMLPLTSTNVSKLTRSPSLPGRLLSETISQARSRHAAAAHNTAWWLAFKNQDVYSQDVFANDPTEQFIIGQAEPFPVCVYNFEEPLARQQLNGITETIHALSDLSQGFSRIVVPNIVIHDAFLPRYFVQSARHGIPDGQAWLGKPFIEVRNAGESALRMNIAHEIAHQIDAAHGLIEGGFSRYFNYVDTNNDGIVECAIPRPSHMRNYTKADILASAPSRDYGLTNAFEDFAVTAEETLFNGMVDRLRRDAFTSIIQEFIAKQNEQHGAQIAGQLVHMVGRTAITIEHRTGSEIEMPTIPDLKRALRITATAHPALLARLKVVL